MKIQAWVAPGPGVPMVLEEREALPGPGEVAVRVAGCGVCHTDLGFYYDGVPTRHPWPLTLGHEISGTVIEAGAGAESWLGRRVIVPAVIPCGQCPACRAGRSAICPKQIFPGNDVHGGFASHVVVPAHGLCRVPDSVPDTGSGLDLASLSVIADAVTTPYEAIRRAELGPDDLAVIVGVGGVGGFGVQVAAALGAPVVAIDVAADRLARAAAHGAGLTLDARATDFKGIRDAVRKFAAARGIPGWRQKIFEMSGTTAGQSTAWGLLEKGGYLAVVGYTPDKLELRLSNLMAFDATARGNWGCPPESYPAVLDLVLAGRVRLDAFVEKRPLGSINQSFAEIHARRVDRRIILIPEP